MKLEEIFKTFSLRKPARTLFAIRKNLGWANVGGFGQVGNF